MEMLESARSYDDRVGLVRGFTRDNPARAALVDPARYYLRIAPVFETAHPDYAWLNGILAIGIGERTDLGARHRIYAVR